MSERFYIEEHKLFFILYGAYKPFQWEFSMWEKMRIIVKYIKKSSYPILGESQMTSDSYTLRVY